MIASRRKSVPLGEVLTPVSREERVEPTKPYAILGARWYAKGLYVKETKPGSSIQAKSVYRVKAGDFVYNRLFAWKGSFAVADHSHDGCYVSNEFPCFRAQGTKLNTKYLHYFLSRQASWDEALGLSTGGTPISRNRLKENQFLAMPVPLPDLNEQDRIVAKLDAVAARVTEAQRLCHEIDDEADALCRAILSDVRFIQTPTPMHELVNARPPDVKVEPQETYHFAGIYCFGKGMFRGQTRIGAEFSYKTLTRLRAGDFAYPKLMAWEGALCVVPPECHGLVVSTEYPVFEIDRSKVVPEVLDVYFRSPNVWPELSGTSKGTNVRRRRLNPEQLLDYRIPLPPRHVQERLATVRVKADAIKSTQRAMLTRLEATMPAILDGAFSGALS